MCRPARDRHRTRNRAGRADRFSASVSRAGANSAHRRGASRPRGIKKRRRRGVNGRVLNEPRSRSTYASSASRWNRASAASRRTPPPARLLANARGGAGRRARSGEDAERHDVFGTKNEDGLERVDGRERPEREPARSAAGAKAVPGGRTPRRFFEDHPIVGKPLPNRPSRGEDVVREPVPPQRVCLHDAGGEERRARASKVTSRTARPRDAVPARRVHQRVEHAAVEPVRVHEQHRHRSLGIGTFEVTGRGRGRRVPHAAVLYLEHHPVRGRDAQDVHGGLRDARPRAGPRDLPCRVRRSASLRSAFGKVEKCFVSRRNTEGCFGARLRASHLRHTATMALPTSRGLFRSLLRARSVAFKGDPTALSAARVEIRKHFDVRPRDRPPPSSLHTARRSPSLTRPAPSVPPPAGVQAPRPRGRAGEDQGGRRGGELHPPARRAAVGNERGNYEMRIEAQHVDGEYEAPGLAARARLERSRVHPTVVAPRRVTSPRSQRFLPKTRQRRFRSSALPKRGYCRRERDPLAPPPPNDTVSPRRSGQVDHRRRASLRRSSARASCRPDPRGFARSHPARARPATEATPYLRRRSGANERRRARPRSTGRLGGGFFFSLGGEK